MIHLATVVVLGLAFLGLCGWIHDWIRDQKAASERCARERQAMHDEWERVWPGYHADMARRILAFRQEHEAKMEAQRLRIASLVWRPRNR